MTAAHKERMMKRKAMMGRIIELGTATRETRGGAIGFVDSDRTLQPHLGLSND
jgi:hypothetical protein